MPTAPPLRPEAADVESSARPLVSGLWESAWPAAEMGRCTWPTRVGTDFEDDDGDTVVLQAYGTVIMYIYRRWRNERTNGSTLHIEVLMYSCSSAAITGIQ
jgi:hypothetical protein